MSSLSKTLSGSGNRKKFTISVWVKRSKFASSGFIFGVGTASTDTGKFSLFFTTQDRLLVEGGATTFKQTSRRYTDPTAWYHIVVAVDTTLADSTNAL